MNKLTDREKFLVYAIVGIVPVVILYFGFTYFMGEMTKRRANLRAVTSKLEKMQEDANYAMILTQVKNDLKQRSLAADQTAAQNEYRDWLQGLVENDIKFGGRPKVTPKATIPIKSEVGKREVLYNQLNFTLDCVGSYKQIVDLLYKFYEKNPFDAALIDMMANRSTASFYNESILRASLICSDFTKSSELKKI